MQAIIMILCCVCLSNTIPLDHLLHIQVLLMFGQKQRNEKYFFASTYELLGMCVCEPNPISKHCHKVVGTKNIKDMTRQFFIEE